MSSRSENPTPAAAPTAGSRWTTTGICLVLVALVMVVFSQCRGFEFVNYDDYFFVTNNNHVLRGLTWENLRWVLSAGIGKGAVDADYWRPLSFFSHMLDVSLFGLNAGAHHVVNLALHALTVLALFLVLRSMTARLWPSAFVAALFAIHPLHVESVAWVAERKDVLSGLCFMLTLGAYTRYTRRPFHPGNYLLVVLLFALGLMSKPMLVTLPCVLLLLDYWPLQRTSSVPLNRLLLEKVPLLALSAAVAVLTSDGPGGSNAQMMAVLPWYFRAGNAIVAYAIYLRQTVWPTGLTCFYPHPRTSLSLGSVAVSAGVLLAITLLVLWQRQRRYLAVGWFWYLGMLVPVIGFIQSGDQAHADRYTYLPLIGLSLMVAWAATDWAREQRQRQMALAATAALTLGGLTVAAQRQTSCWRDGASLWTHALKNTQGNFVAHNDLGVELLRKGSLDEAMTHFQTALEIKPNYAEAHNNLGSALLRKGQMAEAAARFQTALEFKPDYAEAHNNLGVTSFKMGQVDLAISLFRKALEFEPDHVGARINLGNAYFQKGQLDVAITHYDRVLEIKPNFAEAYSNRGAVRLKKGQVNEALADYGKALELKPDFAGAHNNLGNALRQKGQVNEAIIHFQSALEVEPDFADARNNLGNLLLQAGRLDEAITSFQKALETMPNFAGNHINLGVAFLQKGRVDLAITHYQKALEINPKEPMALNNLGWVLATCPEPSVRNGARALELANQASDLSGGNDPFMLDTLAAAQAETGDFAAAVKTAERALTLAATQGNASLTESLRKERDLYLAGKPFRENPSTMPGSRTTTP